LAGREGGLGALYCSDNCIPKAISQHYDLSEEFFKLWLGPEMIYSCAMFDSTSDLASAQIRKLDHHLKAARAAGNDIACSCCGTPVEKIR
jgi:cyclopropane-fatty-acyl-phospholipid synthase